MTEKFISIEGIARRYPGAAGGEIAVFENLWLSMARGEFGCVIGHSGCGKTTVLNILAGLDDPSEGAVIVDGQAIEGTYTLGAKGSTTLFGVKGTIAGGQTTFLLIDDGTNTFTCIESSGQKQCLKSKSGSGGSLIGSLSVDGVIQSVSQDKTTTVTPVTGQTIAGTKANCFAVKGSGSDGTLCAADANGVLLLLDGTFSGNKVSLKATNVNTNPADDDFKPPYTVSELAGGGGR